MSRVVLTCACGASIEAGWTTDRSSYRNEPTPPQLEQFRRDHKRCIGTVVRPRHVPVESLLDEDDLAIMEMDRND